MKLAFASFLIFLIIGLITNSHYGISWDEPTHFKRGQAYLHYFQTGKLTYDLPDYNAEKAKTDPTYHERSMYQINTFDTSYHLNTDGGHPPLNGILSSLSNYIFYQKLGILGDIESYHVFGIFVSALLVGLLCLWASQTFGRIAGIFSAIFMATYPLFLGESHFNIKDPIETTFFVATLYFFWLAIDRKQAKFFILSSISAGIALGTKFNIFFAAPIVALWLIVVLREKHKTLKKFIFSVPVISAIFLFPVIIALIFFGSWPYLWQDLIDNTISVLKYYKDIGTETNFQPNFFVGSINTYAIRWIILTTPPILLGTFAIGLLRIKNEWNKKSSVLILWLALLTVTIARVTVPQTSIYGGVRQIMEYIPSLALIGGIGAAKLIEVLNSRWSVLGIFAGLIIFAASIQAVATIHPNENVYFNSFAGGLKQAKKQGTPGAGNSFGNAYRQAVTWLNENAPIDAKIALVQGTNQNIPRVWFRPDLSFSNYHWSGILKEGEYLMELTHVYETKVYWYAWEYVEKMLTPVHQIQVDGADILTIWKNDLENTKDVFRKQEHSQVIKGDIKDNHLLITLPSTQSLTRVQVAYNTAAECTVTKSARIDTSLDNKRWVSEKDTDVAGIQLPKANDPNLFQYFFASRDAQFVRIYPSNSDSCLFKNPKVTVVTLR